MNGIPQALRGRRLRPLPVAVGALVVIGVAALAVAFDWNWFKGPLERYVSGITGRTFAIRGDLDVDLGSIIRIDGTHVFLGNAPWASSSYLARADRVRIDIALWPLLAGRWTVPRIELKRPVLDFERNARGEPNWRLRNAAQPSQRRITFGELLVHDGTLRLREPRLRTDLLVNVDSAPLVERTRHPHHSSPRALGVIGMAGSRSPPASIPRCTCWSTVARTESTSGLERAPHERGYMGVSPHQSIPIDSSCGRSSAARISRTSFRCSDCRCPSRRPTSCGAG